MAADRAGGAGDGEAVKGVLGEDPNGFPLAAGGFGKGCASVTYLEFAKKLGTAVTLGSSLSLGTSGVGGKRLTMGAVKVGAVDGDLENVKGSDPIGASFNLLSSSFAGSSGV